MKIFEPENGNFEKSCHVRIFIGIFEILICTPRGILEESCLEGFFFREKILNLKMMLLGIEDYLWSIWDICLYL